VSRSTVAGRIASEAMRGGGTLVWVGVASEVGVAEGDVGLWVVVAVSRGSGASVGMGVDSATDGAQAVQAMARMTALKARRKLISQLLFGELVEYLFACTMPPSISALSR
jgi:hypothetical protein